MASISNDLLRKLLIKYAGVPNQEAILAADEMDELRQYATAAALLADLANVRVGSFAYAIDTGAVYLRSTSAFILTSDPVSGGEAFLQRKTTLDATEIKNMAATQPDLVPAVAGKLAVVHDAVFELVAGSEVLTESDDNMVIKYVDAAGVAASGTIEATGFIDQLTNQFALTKGIDIALGSVAQLVNTALVLDNTGDGEYAGNASDDATMEVWCRYSLLTVS